MTTLKKHNEHNHDSGTGSDWEWDGLWWSRNRKTCKIAIAKQLSATQTEALLAHMGATWRCNNLGDITTGILGICSRAVLSLANLCDNLKYFRCKIANRCNVNMPAKRTLSSNSVLKEQTHLFKASICGFVELIFILSLQKLSHLAPSIIPLGSLSSHRNCL